MAWKPQKNTFCFRVDSNTSKTLGFRYKKAIQIAVLGTWPKTIIFGYLETLRSETRAAPQSPLMHASENSYPKGV